MTLSRGAKRPCDRDGDVSAHRTPQPNDRFRRLSRFQLLVCAPECIEIADESFTLTVDVVAVQIARGASGIMYPIVRNPALCFEWKSRGAHRRASRGVCRDADISMRTRTRAPFGHACRISRCGLRGHVGARGSVAVDQLAAAVSDECRTGDESE
jgi:hypothetical protein